MRYLLDTNICIYFLKRHGKIIDKLSELPQDDLAISCFNLTELLFGAYNSDYPDRNLKRVRFIENTISVLPFDRNAMEFFASIKATLRKQGTIIDDLDLLIASVAMSNQLILVTNNEKHFSRISGLQIENWTK